jgi:PAS domain S-box-containing protein
LANDSRPLDTQLQADRVPGEALAALQDLSEGAAAFDMTTPEGALGVLTVLARQYPHDASRASSTGPDAYALKKHQLLLEQIPAVTFSADLCGGLSDLYVSPQIEALLGFTREEWLEDPVRWYRQLHPDDKTRWTRDFARVITSAEPFAGVYRFLAKSGQVVWVRGAVNFIRDEAGRPRFLHGVGFDISEIKKGELATQAAEKVLRDAKRTLERQVEQRTEELQLQLSELRRAEERFQRAVEASPSAMLVSDVSGKILLVNRQLQLLFQYEEHELLGRSVDLLVPGASRASHSDLREGYFHEPTARRMGEGRDLYGQRKDGSLVPVEIGLTPIRTSEGWITISAVMDITQRQQREAVLRDQAGRLERSNQELEGFAHVVSHDLQEPLRQISNYAQLLRACLTKPGEDSQKRGEKYLSRLSESAERMRRMINDLLLYSRVSSSKDAELVNLETVVDEVCADLDALIVSSGARLLRSPLPTLRIRRLHMQQLFQNLIHNAIKYRRPAVPPVVEISASVQGNKLHLAIADNGIGIAPEHSAKAFKIFQRLHTDTNYEGTGIGLAICKKVVDLYEGHIGISANQPCGTRFELWLRLDVPP